jgi:hypothetical protein
VTLVYKNLYSMGPLESLEDTAPMGTCIHIPIDSQLPLIQPCNGVDTRV